MRLIKRVFKEPLLHFLLLGVVIFAGYNTLADGAAEEQRDIRVTQDKVRYLEERFRRAWHRPPDARELDGLIQDYIREEAAVQEAAALQLDRNDTVIRRLMRQRLEFVTEDVAGSGEPSDVQLEAYLRGHADNFRTETRISFTHVFLDPKRHGDALGREAAQLRARLNAVGGRVDPAELGDATLLERHFTALPLGEAARMFGEPFAEALRAQPVGRWSTPLTSTYGEHLVYVSEIVPGAMPSLAEVRDDVRREWDNARRIAARERYYAALLQRYRVTVERPPSAAADDRLARLP